jgi:tight adherence protein B
MTSAAAVCVLLAAAATMWPVPGARARRRRLLAVADDHGSGGVRCWLDRGTAARLLDCVRTPRRGPAWLVVAAGVASAVLLGGVVAGAVVGVYGSLAARAVTRREQERAEVRHRAALLDALGAAAADLRAGLPADTALAGLDPASPDPLLARVRAAVRLAERTGAPLAEALERIEADARSTARARFAAAAQAAGSRATAWLLAALPVGGIGLGYAIGADPLAVLLHTPIGAACAFGAVTLQLAGLAWAGRITRPSPAVAS